MLPRCLLVSPVLAVLAHCHRYGRVSVTGPEQCAGPQSRQGFKGNAGLPDAAPGADGTFGCGAKTPEETEAFGCQRSKRICVQLQIWMRMISHDIRRSSSASVKRCELKLGWKNTGGLVL